MRARCWNLRLNLDIFNAAFAALDDQADRSDFLMGLSRGMNGGKVKEDCSDPMSVGFSIGEAMRSEAEGFREQSAINGAKRKSNKNDHVVNQEVNQIGTQSTIHNPQSKQTKKRRKVADATAPAEYVNDLETIIDNWPTTTLYRNDGGSWEKRKVTMVHTADHLWDRMVRFCPGEEPTLLVNCAISYLNEVMGRDKVDGIIPNVCAMTNFFGEKAIWKRFVGEAMEER